MTTTYANMVDEALLNLSGYTLRQDRSTHLTQDITSSGLTLNLADVSNIGKGVVEIDDELIWIDSYESAPGVKTYLCDFCPVAIGVAQRKQKLMGL